MRSKAWWILSITAMIFIQAPRVDAASENPALVFDLFGFQIASADLGLGKRAQALGEALAKVFPQDLAVQKFRENSYSGLCLVKGVDHYKMAWHDSETEGFLFSVERFSDPETCESPFTESVTFPTAQLNPAAFFPISHSHPTIQLGVSTLAQVRKDMGNPSYAASDSLFYALKRDRAKEKGCGMKPSKGELAAIGVQFRFKQGVLQSIYLVNWISGEC